MKKLPTYKIPFDKDGKFLNYPDVSPIDWRDNYQFTAALEYDGYSRGRSSALVNMKDHKTGISYPMFMSTFDELMKGSRQFIDPPTGKLFFVGTWTFCKRGSNYALKMYEI